MKLLYIGNKLSQHGFNKTTVETLGEDLAKEGFHVVSVSNKKNFFLRLFEMIWITLTESKVDYIIIDTYSTKAFLYTFMCSQIARFRNIKYTPILHGGNLPIRLKDNPILSSLVFKNAYQNVAPSNYLKSEFVKFGFNNIVYIPNTIEIEKYAFKKRTKIEPKLLWVRAFSSIYNPRMAIDVLVQLKKTFPNASLTMVGPDKDGSLQSAKRYAQLNKVDVSFTGQLSKEEWWKLSENHSIFINTTNFDNTPVSVMEAMALGLPVVTTNVGGIPYLLSDEQNALLVRPNDVNAMVSKIEVLMHDENLAAKLSQNGREEAMKWDWNVVKQQWGNLLQ